MSPKRLRAIHAARIAHFGWLRAWWIRLIHRPEHAPQPAPGPRVLAAWNALRGRPIIAFASLQMSEINAIAERADPNPLRVVGCLIHTTPQTVTHNNIVDLAAVRRRLKNEDD